MRRLLQAIGMLALVVWTGAGGVAWQLTREQVAVTISQGGGHAEVAANAALEERVHSLEQDLHALAQALGDNFEVLGARLEAVDGEHRTSLTRALEQLGARVDALGHNQGHDQAWASVREQLAALGARLDAARASVPVVEPSATDPRPAAPEPELVSADNDPQPSPQTQPADDPALRPDPPPAPPATKRGFLAFKLPSADFDFAERRRWTLVPSLSRVGFDAKSTLHDFTGVTSNLTGELEANLTDAAAAPHARIRVDVSGLDTGLSDRNAAMREHLASEKYPEITYVLDGFSVEQVDAKAQSVSGTAHGRMTIRGVSKDLAMAVRMHVDDSRRLAIEGEAPLRLTDYGVPVPSKLGVISMQDEVRVWVALRARPQARATEH